MAISNWNLISLQGFSFHVTLQQMNLHTMLHQRGTKLQIKCL